MPTPTSKLLSGLQNDTTIYKFKVAAVNVAGTGSYSVPSSGITPLSSLPDLIPIEYLVVAGGAGAGSNMGGGGGAGGLRTNLSSYLLLDAGTSYVITVGAGGTGAPAGYGQSNGNNGSDSSILTEGSLYDPYFDNVSLLMHMDGNSNIFVDSSSAPKNIVASGNAIQTTNQSKFGGISLYCDGDNDFLITPTSSSFNWSAGDCVIEAWINPASLTGTRHMFTTSSGHSDSAFGAYVASNGSIRAGKLGVNEIASSAGIISIDTWHYVVFVKSGSSAYIYVDGNRVASGSSSQVWSSGSAPFTIGKSYQNGDLHWHGYIDELRVTLGTDRVYNGDSISVPSSAFPNIGRIVTAIGGGGGASDYNNYRAGNSGGCGGGGAPANWDGGIGNGGSGTSQQGYAGGSGGGGGGYYPGGGGGAGGVGAGTPGHTSRGHGGPGVLNTILGTAYYWAGGGGASGYTTTGGDGGIGGGGGGAVGTTTGGSGINPGSPGGGGSTVSQTNTPGGNAGANTGGGGGGGSHYNANNYGGNGGTGIVIIRTFITATSTTGSPTVIVDGDYNVYVFTGAGSITF